MFLQRVTGMSAVDGQEIERKKELQKNVTYVTKMFAM